jgi:hypothetical protein
MSVIRVNVPPDHTPDEEAALVAQVAASYEESTGRKDVTVEVNRSEEVDYRSIQAHTSSRWASCATRSSLTVRESSGRTSSTLVTS